MDWTSLYLKTKDLNVFILGTGEVATRRANRFLDHGANVRLAGNNLSSELESKGAVLCSTDGVDEFDSQFAKKMSQEKEKQNLAAEIFRSTMESST